MKTLVTLLAIFISPVTLSADWRNIDGIYAVTSRGYLDPSEDEQKDSHFRIQLKGKSAKDLYAAMKVKPVIDECTGGMAKNVAEMQCLYFKAGSNYECHFSIDIAKQKVEYGVAC
jgi:hypothetical protein